MNDDENNPQPKPWIDPALEARIVASVLGETSAFEAAELERAVAESPELAIFKRRIEAVHALVGAAVGSENPKIQLSPERRAKLLANIGISPLKAPEKVAVHPPARPAWWSSPLLIRLAASVIMGSIFVTILSSVGLFKPSGKTFIAEDASDVRVDVTGMRAPEPTARSAAGKVVSMGLVTEADAIATVVQAPMPQAEALQDAQQQSASDIEPSPVVRTAPTSGPIAADNLSASTTIAAKEIDALLFAQTPSAAPVPVAEEAMQTQSAPAEDRAFTGEWGTGGGAGRGVADAAREEMAADDEDGGVKLAQGLDSLDQSVKVLAEEKPPQVPLMGDIPPVGRTFQEKSKKDNAAPPPAEVPNVVGQPIFSTRDSVVEFDGFINYGSPITTVVTAQAAEAEEAGQLLEAAQTFSEAGRSDLDYKQTLNVDPDNIEARREMEKLNAARAKYADSAGSESQDNTLLQTDTRLGMPARQLQAEDSATVTVDQAVEVRGSKLVTTSNLKLIDTLLESKKGVPETPPSSAEILTAKQPFSTFSLHVSDVSFQLARDALAKGALPDPDRIRAEEFYNAFDYNDPSPAPGEEVACRIEQSAHPFLQQRNLVRIAVKAAATGRVAGQPLRLTILLDTSGSMEREDRAASVRRALQALATLLGPNDRVTLIGFARTPRLLAEQVPGDQAGKLVEIADRTPSEGGTNLEEALALASESALKQKLPAAQNRIVLLTDGAANLGNANPARLARQIEKTRQQGVSFDACGVGANGLNDEMLEALTRKGDGRYYFLNKPGDADAGFARQLAGALRPAAENVKVQVVFNPARVRQYRLIGFEKHLLKKEDFRNDKVQAAELSAEEAGVALYQVETLPEGEGELGQVFVRFRDPASGSMVERSWPMPYDPQARAFDQASPSMQLAATAALLAEKLKGNSQVNLDGLAPVINNLRGHYPNQTRVADLIQMYERLRQ